MNITRYPVLDPTLQIVAEFVWHITGDGEDMVNSKLLPVINTDLIINLSNAIYYRFIDGAEEKAPPVHIRNVKKTAQMIRQEGKIDVWGVSFYPYGLYPFEQETSSFITRRCVRIWYLVRRRNAVDL